MQIIRNLFLLVLIIILGACAKPPPPPPQKIDTTNLSELQDLKRVNMDKYDQSKAINPIRMTALKDTAMTIGAQGALALRSKQIDDILTKDTKYLSQAFNFESLMLPNNVLPPVLVEGRRTLNLADNQTIRIEDRTYTIEQQAKFVTTAPTWHDYLWMDFKQPDQPDNTLLPKNRREAAVWKKYVEEGWRQGIQQANNIFAENVSRMKRDYQGMILYRKLVDQNMISTPYVATTPLGVTGDGNQLSIDDKVKRITALPQLNKDAKNWKPAVAEPVDH